MAIDRLIDACRPGQQDPASLSAALLVLADAVAEAGDPAGAAIQAALADPLVAPVGVERHAADNDTDGRLAFDVLVVRHRALADAIGLAPDARAPDVEYVLMPAIAGPASAPYLIARTPVSQRTYDATGGTHGRYASDDGPLQPATRADGDEWATWAESLGLRLPTADEWTHAARGAATTRFWFGDDRHANPDANDLEDEDLEDTDDDDDRLPDVGSQSPNSYGLHEIHGYLYQLAADADGPVFVGSMHLYRGGDLEDRTHADIGDRAWATLRPARTPGAGVALLADDAHPIDADQLRRLLIRGRRAWSNDDYPRAGRLLSRAWRALATDETGALGDADALLDPLWLNPLEWIAETDHPDLPAMLEPMNRLVERGALDQLDDTRLQAYAACALFIARPDALISWLPAIRAAGRDAFIDDLDGIQALFERLCEQERWTDAGQLFGAPAFALEQWLDHDAMFDEPPEATPEALAERRLRAERFERACREAGRDAEADAIAALRTERGLR